MLSQFDTAFSHFGAIVKKNLSFVSKTGLMQQFSENLADAGLLDHSAECLRLSSHLNQHSQQEQLLKAVLVAGLYPNLIQVPHTVHIYTSRYSVYAGHLYVTFIF